MLALSLKFDKDGGHFGGFAEVNVLTRNQFVFILVGFCVFSFRTGYCVLGKKGRIQHLWKSSFLCLVNTNSVP